MPAVTAFRLPKQHACCSAGQYQLRLEGGGEEWRHLTDNVRWISASPLEESSSALSTSDEVSSDDSEEARIAWHCPALPPECPCTRAGAYATEPGNSQDSWHMHCADKGIWEVHPHWTSNTTEMTILQNITMYVPSHPSRHMAAGDSILGDIVSEPEGDACDSRGVCSMLGVCKCRLVCRLRVTAASPSRHPQCARKRLQSALSLQSLQLRR